VKENSLVLVVIVAAIVLGVPVMARSQPAATVARMTDDPCPAQVPVGPPPEMRAAMLKPGAKPPAMPQISDEQMQAYRKKMAEDQARDFANLCRYKPDNVRVSQGQRPRAVFMGDSITEGWMAGDPSLFSQGVVDRGISGQTSPQMLLRFYQDVIALRPTVVHIMAGTNDLAANTGPSSPEDYKNNIRAMVDLAQANNIKVVLASILPADRFPWRTDLQPADQIRQLNTWLRQFAAERKVVFADYYTEMATPTGATKPALSNDGVHPNSDGYAAMRPIANAALQRAVSAR
jgi:lysophospholipase L1-like esterase